ncbi:MAG: prevent-host-death protein [Syntrophobacteraceae bacterium]
MGRIQYISDENNNVTGVIVPIDLWRDIQSEKETAWLLKSETMKKRLIEAKNRKEGIPFDKVCKEPGIDPDAVEDLACNYHY